MSRKCGKRLLKVKRAHSTGKLYDLKDAIAVLHSICRVKFEESVDFALQLGIDSRRGEQMVRGSCALPHGIGKTKSLAVITGGEDIRIAMDAGADAAGSDDLIEEFKKGVVGYDVILATVDVMPKLGRVGSILGPRGLMPNPKDGTVVKDVQAAVLRIKSGVVKFKADKGGVLHASIGRVTFASSQLRENIVAFVSEVNRLKPSSSKGVYLKKAWISTTMGPGLPLRTTTLQ